MTFSRPERLNIARAIKEGRETPKSAAERYNRDISTIYSYINELEEEERKAQGSKKISSFFAAAARASSSIAALSISADKLHRACSNGKVEQVRILLKQNYSDCKQPNAEEKLPGHHAFDNNHYLVILEIFFAAILNSDTDHANTIIHALESRTDFKRKLATGEIESAVLKLIDLHTRESRLGRWRVDGHPDYDSRDQTLGHPDYARQDKLKNDKLISIRHMLALWQPALKPYTPLELENYYAAAIQHHQQYFSFSVSDNSDSDDNEDLAKNEQDVPLERRKRVKHLQRVKHHRGNDDPRNKFWRATRRTTVESAGLIDKLKELLESDNPISQQEVKYIQTKILAIQLEKRATLPESAARKKYVALFRGNNYMFDRWSDPARLCHYKLDEVGSPQFCEAALKELPYDFYRELNQSNCFLLRPELKQKLVETTETMRQEYQTFTRNSYPIETTVPPGKQADFLFNSERDHLQHEFSNGINEHLLEMRSRIEAEPGRWGKCFINAYNYALATSTRPYHAFKYTVGLKEYYADAFPLRYNQDGSLLNSHAGKVLLMLMTKKEFITQDNLNRVVKSNHDSQVPIDMRILPELETSFIGNTPNVIYQHELKFPAFNKDWRPIDEIKYGLNKELYLQFKDLIQRTALESPERKAVIDLLKEWLCAYHEVLLLSIAREEAAMRDGDLVYVNHQDTSTTIPDKSARTSGIHNKPTRDRANVLQESRFQLAYILQADGYENDLLPGQRPSYLVLKARRTAENLRNFLTKFLSYLVEQGQPYRSPAENFIDAVRGDLARFEARDIIMNNLDTF